MYNEWLEAAQLFVTKGLLVTCACQDVPLTKPVQGLEHMYEYRTRHRYSTIECYRAAELKLDIIHGQASFL